MFSIINFLPAFVRIIDAKVPTGDFINQSAANGSVSSTLSHTSPTTRMSCRPAQSTRVQQLGTRKAELDAKLNIEPWIIRHLRRTARSLMSRGRGAAGYCRAGLGPC